MSDEAKWWVIHEDDLRGMLDAAARGERVESVFARGRLQSGVERIEDLPNVQSSRPGPLLRLVETSDSQWFSDDERPTDRSWGGER